MRHVRKGWKKKAAALGLAAILLTACGGVTDEMLASREAAIAMMEAGDYEGAVAVFNDLVAEAKSVTEFELDLLQYRAEAEFLLGDYAAAVHTYQTLMEVDGKKTEYSYPAAIASAEIDRADGRLEDAEAIYLELIDDGYGNTDLYNRMMGIAIENGEYERALAMAEKGLTLSDDLAKQELQFNEAVCYEYLGKISKALELFLAYEEEYGSDERTEHEIAFLKTRE